MNLFYCESLTKDTEILEDEEFRHLNVLRISEGQEIYLTDGKGQQAKARISKLERKRAQFDIIDLKKHPRKPFFLRICIAPTKQMERMEWFVEKACEFGVDEIQFIICQNSERPKLKLDRLEKKAISALKQSKGFWKTTLVSPVKFSEALKSSTESTLIASVDKSNVHLMDSIQPKTNNSIFIGPEGDFSSAEIQLSHELNYSQVSLGERVLRTETAGIAVAQMVNSINRH